MHTSPYMAANRDGVPSAVSSRSIPTGRDGASCTDVCMAFASCCGPRPSDSVAEVSPHLQRQNARSARVPLSSVTRVVVLFLLSTSSSLLRVSGFTFAPSSPRVSVLGGTVSGGRSPVSACNSFSARSLSPSLLPTSHRGTQLPIQSSAASLSFPLSVLELQNSFVSRDLPPQTNSVSGSPKALRAFVAPPSHRAGVGSRAPRVWASPQASCLRNGVNSENVLPSTSSSTLAAGVQAGEKGAAPAPEIFPFQAEVKRVLDIIVNSLYTDRDVFLRELISNAADASDKKRMLMEKEGRKFRGSIRVRADREKNTLTIEDDGIGMSKTELINNLGTIAQSGTYRFLQQLKEQQAAGAGASTQASSLIGQFGVGFYSAFLVADAVEVYSTAWQGGEGATGKEREVWKWKSTCGQTFTLEKVDAEAERARCLAERKVLQEHWKKQKAEKADQATRGDSGSSQTEGEEKAQGEEKSQGTEEEEEPQDWSGTRVVLHLKEDSDDYLEDYKLKELMRKYSEFIQLPIHIWSERIEYERVPEGSEQAAAPPASSASADGQMPGLTRLTPENIDEQLGKVAGDPGARRQSEPGFPSSTGAAGTKFKTVTHRYYEWEHLNTQPPIWRRDEKLLTDKDYVDFYKSTFKVGSRKGDWFFTVVSASSMVEGDSGGRALCLFARVLRLCVRAVVQRQVAVRLRRICDTGIKYMFLKICLPVWCCCAFVCVDACA
ncbi:Hsp90 domain-containing protein [Toxoplasma gondii TgCatPRC2]|uniref:Hsp90 domain-containing protein n=1 Tax=Toxoplasma gondii TgCatPRC2 TaxID=1130821 RepID=A0A151HL32_TOXGO|nr:Hsp90 domain-containing protein [Toxoplasma gondii TgCatPRC2]